MRSYLKILLVFVFLLAGCMAPFRLSVSLASPANGSVVPSLVPTLSWGGGGGAATYRLTIAKDDNFQNVVLDVSNIRDQSYTVPSGEIEGDTWYYWRVLARQGNQISSWTAPWSFRTPQGIGPKNTGTVRVSATLDGSPWSGAINYSIGGPFSDTDNSVPWDFKSVPAGTYTVTYNYGGPKGAVLVSITPQPTLELVGGGTITFVLNFHSQTSSNIVVNATLNGSPWSGNVAYTLSGAFTDAETIVPKTLSNLPSGSYTLTYNSGGPSGAILSGISPSPTQFLPNNGSITYTLNFSTVATSSLSVFATYKGATWAGPVQFSISGPISGSYTAVPLQLDKVPPGTYNIYYKSGGPPGATMGSIVPGPSLTISSGSSGSFVFNFYEQPQTGNVVVNANLNGSPWSGVVNYTLCGPTCGSDSQVPRTYNNIPVGTYTLTYMGGGPAGATLANITPSPTQSLASGRTIGFNLNFVSQPVTGTITVSATLDGQPWMTQLGSGPISYTITGPSSDSGSTIPGTFRNMAPGRYTLSYLSGGPIGATLTGISPSPTQDLAPGGSIHYVLQFTGQPKGYVIVRATIDGQEWAGQVGYVLQGPYVESGGSVPRTFGNAPQGTYTVRYASGGPPQCTFIGVSPPSQVLPAGGSITFTLNFRFQSGLRPPSGGSEDQRPLKLMTGEGDGQLWMIRRPEK